MAESGLTHNNCVLFSDQTKYPTITEEEIVEVFRGKALEVEAFESLKLKTLAAIQKLNQ